MEASYNGGGYPDILFAREFLTNTSGYPALASPPALNYDPRSINSLTLNCHLLRTIPDLIPDADQIADSPDNFLAANELSQPTTLVQQILTEMSRGRVTSTGTAESAILATQYVDKDIFAIDVDSRDGDECDLADLGNNLNELTVRSGAGSMLWGNFSSLEPHIARNLNASALGQTIYDRPAADPVLGYVLTLTPGKSYTVIVAGTGGTVGNYELRIRKINHDSIREAIVRPVTASGKCISLAE
jgi:hypothetical protein